MAKKKHKVKGMRIRKAHGGFIATHEMPPDENGVTPQEQEHILPEDARSLGQHVMDHFQDEPLPPTQGQ